MGIFSFFTDRRRARLVEKTATEVAARSYQAVLDRVRRRAASMRVSEARGYVRSRTLDIVRRELTAVYNGRITVDAATQTQIVGQATEALVVRVMAELRSVPPAARGKRQAA
jgi:hypothetical protein